MHKIVVVTVTYGKRAHLLVQALESAFREGVTKAIVVDNGSQDDIQTILDQKFTERVKVVPMGRNTGSAQGFAEGLKTAYADDAEFIFILDDDNILDKGTLAILKNAWFNSCISTNKSDLVLLGLRLEQLGDISQGISLKHVSQHKDTFLGFHVADIPLKLLRHTPWLWHSKKTQNKILPAQVDMAVAPYSGMFFHRSLLAKHGYPDLQFVLYADDSEFSNRVIRDGGRIVLMTNARVIDIEPSWMTRNQFRTTFEGLLLGDGDSRAYYSVRNQLYFEKYYLSRSKIIRAINRFFYMIILCYFVWRHGKITRFRIIYEAIKDGENGRLGININYPIK
jgi:GT2 family glycosyltransferase